MHWQEWPGNAKILGIITKGVYENFTVSENILSPTFQFSVPQIIAQNRNWNRNSDYFRNKKLELSAAKSIQDNIKNMCEEESRHSEVSNQRKIALHTKIKKKFISSFIFPIVQFWMERNILPARKPFSNCIDQRIRFPKEFLKNCDWKMQWIKHHSSQERINQLFDNLKY